MIKLLKYLYTKWNRIKSTKLIIFGIWTGRRNKTIILIFSPNITYIQGMVWGWEIIVHHIRFQPKMKVVKYTQFMCNILHSVSNLQLCSQPFFDVYYPILPVPFNQLIEACVQNCGQRFHTEVGKYRFLNELIKLISSKVIIFLITTLLVVLRYCFFGQFYHGKWPVLCRNFILLVHVTIFFQILYFPYANVQVQFGFSLGWFLIFVVFWCYYETKEIKEQPRFNQN